MKLDASSHKRLQPILQPRAWKNQTLRRVWVARQRPKGTDITSSLSYLCTDNYVHARLMHVVGGTSHSQVPQKLVRAVLRKGFGRTVPIELCKLTW